MNIRKKIGIWSLITLIPNALVLYYIAPNFDAFVWAGIMFSNIFHLCVIFSMIMCEGEVDRKFIYRLTMGSVIYDLIIPLIFMMIAIYDNLTATTISIVIVKGMWVIPLGCLWGPLAPEVNRNLPIQCE